jgi:lysophospholipase L1-like esterase
MKSERHWVGTWTTAPAPAEGRERDLPRRRLDPGARSDAVVDFDRTLRDPAHPARMLPIYDCGDHLHPSDLGYNAMGDAIDLALFD